MIQLKTHTLKDLHKALQEDQKNYYRQQNSQYDNTSDDTNNLLAKAGKAFELIIKGFDGKHYTPPMFPTEADQRYSAWLQGLAELGYFSDDNLSSRKQTIRNTDLKYYCSRGNIINVEGKTCICDWEVFRNSPLPYKYLLSCGRGLAMGIEYLAMARLLMNGKILLSICPASDWTEQLTDRLDNCV